MVHRKRTRTIMLTWCLLSCVPGIHAQTAGDIDTLGQWRINETWGSHLYIQYDYYKYYISGTININSQEYYKVYRSGYYHINNDPNVYYNSYFAPLREASNKWYTVDIDINAVLLYDFTLNVGDTVNSFANFNGDLITIADIDTIMIDGESKKKFILSDNYGAEYIIEDIGASTGLFEPLTWFDNWSILRCFAIDYVPIWLNPASGSCDLSVDISEIQEEDENYIYSNPAQESIILIVPLHSEVNIIDAMGRELMCFTSNEKQLKIDVSWLNDGIYHAQIIHNGERAIRSFVKK